MGFLSKLFKKSKFDIDINKVCEVFGVKPCIDSDTSDYYRLFNSIYSGEPPWVSGATLYDFIDNCSNSLKTLNIAKTICNEITRLTLMEVEIEAKNAPEDSLINEIIKNILNQLPQHLEHAVAVGGMIMKPTTNGIDFINISDCIPIEFDLNGNIIKIIFIDNIEKNNNKYMRIEYHDYKKELYTIKNKAFLKSSDGQKLQEIPLGSVPEWEEIAEEVTLKNVEEPFYSYFKYPSTNNLTLNTDFGVSCFSNAINQMEDLDIAYTRMIDEIEQSEKIVFVPTFAIDSNERSVLRGKQNVLPKYVVGLEMGVNENNTIHEHNPIIQTEKRKEGLNTLLSLIGYQCGFSNGYFVFNEKTGLATATQIEADQQRTVQLIYSVRKELEKSLRKLITATQEIYQLYGLGDISSEELSFYFKDITVNFEEDRKRNIELVKLNILPKWKYLVEFEGYTEENAKEMVEEANKDGGSQMQDDYGNQIEQIKEQYQKGNKTIYAETEERDKGQREV